MGFTILLEFVSYAFKHELHINFETNHLSSYSSIRARTVHFSNIQFTTPLKS